MKYGRRVTECRMCLSQHLHNFIDMGFAPPSDALLTKAELQEPEIFFPLQVQQCDDCGLTQTVYAVDPALMYGDKYKYESSMTQTGMAHFFKMAASIVDTCEIAPGSLAIDIGSNVGVLLEGFQKKALKVLGIDPAPRIVKIANARGIETWQEFMRPEVARRIVKEKGKAQVVTGTNVFAHIDDKPGLIEALDHLLDAKGIFVIEVPYLVDLIENLEYDTIYHEHLEYMSLKPLVLFFGRHGFDVFNVERHEIHGKSIRVFMARKGERPIQPSVAALLQLEDDKGIYRHDVLEKFAREVAESAFSLRSLLNELRRQGKRVVGISAPAKGNTILNYCKIGPELVQYMTEKSVIKQGSYTPGMHIPIMGDAKLMEDKPDYGIIFAWNFASEIMKNNQAFADQGGKFIIPIPTPRIV
jgi:SAM-dependent methyltransferase